MGLLDEIQKLPLDCQAEIMTSLQNHFPDSIELEAYTYLLVWAEIQPWDLAKDVDIPEHVALAERLLAITIEQLQGLEKQFQESPGNFQGMMTVPKIKEIYTKLQVTHRSEPTKFCKAFGAIDYYLKAVVKQFINRLLNGDSSTMDQGCDMDTEQAPDNFTLIQRELHQADVQYQENNKIMKTIEQAKEQFTILFEEKKTEMDLLELQKQEVMESSMSEKDKEKNVLELSQKTLALQTELSNKGRQLTVEMRLNMVQNLDKHLHHLYKISASLGVEIDQWKEKQQKALSGWPQPQVLEPLQNLCEPLAELLWRLYQHCKKVDEMFKPALQKSQEELNRMQNLIKSSKTLLSIFLNKCFVIEKHAPQILKIGTKFCATLRHLIGGKLNAHVHPPEVECFIVPEKFLQKNKDKIVRSILGKSTILNYKKAMEYSQRYNSFSVEFKNLNLTKTDREGGKKDETVCEKKRSLLFYTELTIGQDRFPLLATSFPCVVTVHGNQSPDAEATILWDNAFAEKGRVPFVVPDSMPWPEVANAINHRWMLSNERGLSDEQLAYIGSKLFPDKSRSEMSNCVVSRYMLNKGNMTNKNFTFWKWFYEIMSAVKKTMHEEWKHGLIQGFLSKQQAQDMLINSEFGTFLLRFSDNELGGVSVAYTAQAENGEKQVWNLAPWTTHHLQVRHLSDRLKDLESLLILYPNEPKDTAFGRHYTVDKTQVPSDPLEYRPTQLATKVIGADGSCTPVQQPRVQMDLMSQYSADTYPGSPADSLASQMLDADFGIGGEEIVESFGEVDAAMMISGVNNLMGFGGPQDFMNNIFENQCSIAPLSDVPSPGPNNSN
ncbi:predicted protein [Nematostella vectensis]|uniref:Signal transducer and activator of transcription n=1 Tax=Nematostella vectensis TaxID=45351 RepID=A7S084_NEMVE|nr:predicted protein [Nematostella vectensis]|eukprot:XP_001635036.1 predicted protein [Nematostella vectensis]